MALPKIPTTDKYYTREQLAELNEYAKYKNIEIIPEFDVPGHATSIVTAYSTYYITVVFDVSVFEIFVSLLNGLTIVFANEEECVSPSKLAMVVCVVNDNPVGVDIEKIRHVDLNTAKRIFSDEEIGYIFGSVPGIEDYRHYLNDAVLQRFFELWTKKEAYGKLVGMGLFAESNVDTELTTLIEKGYCISIAASVNASL